MDSDRFDDWTKRLATRRSFLRGAGGAVAALLGLAAADHAPAAPLCPEPRIRCGRGQEQHCCPDGQICKKGLCSWASGAGSLCRKDANCDKGLICHSSYQICTIPNETCGFVTMRCTRDAECCEDNYRYCVEGWCSEPGIG
jgi:hypothetical protein